jgi:hypothetical protein
MIMDSVALFVPRLILTVIAGLLLVYERLERVEQDSATHKDVKYNRINDVVYSPQIKEISMLPSFGTRSSSFLH